VQSLDPSLPVFDVKTMTDHLGISLLPARLAGSVLGLFGLVAVVLATQFLVKRAAPSRARA